MAGTTREAAMIETAVVAGGVRPATARSAREANARRAGARVPAPAGRDAGGPGAASRRTTAQPGQPVRPRRALVARPHGARPPSAGRAHDAQLARPLGDLERQGRRRQADAAPAAHAAPLRARQLPHAGARHGARRRHADLARPGRLERRGAQRELRARVLRAVHARREQRLHGEGHPRVGARAHRLHVRLRHQALRLRPEAARRRHEAHPRQARALRPARRRRPRAREPAPRAVPVCAGVGLLLAAHLPAAAAQARSSRPTRSPATRSSRCSR